MNRSLAEAENRDNDELTERIDGLECNNAVLREEKENQLLRINELKATLEFLTDENGNLKEELKIAKNEGQEFRKQVEYHRKRELAANDRVSSVEKSCITLKEELEEEKRKQVSTARDLTKRNGKTDTMKLEINKLKISRKEAKIENVTLKKKIEEMSEEMKRREKSFERDISERKKEISSMERKLKEQVAKMKNSSINLETKLEEVTKQREKQKKEISEQLSLEQELRKEIDELRQRIEQANSSPTELIAIPSPPPIDYFSPPTDDNVPEPIFGSVNTHDQEGTELESKQIPISVYRDMEFRHHQQLQKVPPSKFFP